MRARKVDGNLRAIVQAAREMGFRIYVRNDPLADLDASLAGVHEIWECKNGAKAIFTKTQKKLREAGWIIRTIRSVDDLVLARAEMTRDASAIQRARNGVT